MLLIPAIDLRQGRCVRLLHGDFAAETRYEATPRALLATYRSYGATWLHVVDLDGAREGALANRELIADLAGDSGVRLQVGGGIRTSAAIAEWLDCGVSRVVIGSAAVERPGEVAEWIRRFGSERVCLALDVRLDETQVPRVHTRGWTKGTSSSLWATLERYPGGLVRHVLCTDIGRDGALTGPNLELYTAALARYPAIAWQASGGVRDAADLAALAALGLTAAVSGKALLERRIRAEELRPFLPDASSPA